MKKIGIVVAALCLLVVFVSPALAEQHDLFPTSVQSSGGFGFPRLLYEHRSGNALIYLRPSTDFWPTRGTVTTDGPGGRNEVKQLTFHRVTGDSSWFSSVENLGWFDETYEIGSLKLPGDFRLVFHYENDSGSWVQAMFDLRLLVFDFDESACFIDREVVALDYTVWSFEDLPSGVDSIVIQLEDGKLLTFSNIPFVGVSHGFGWVNIPFKRYKALIAGKELATTFTIRGRSITSWVRYSPMAAVRIDCPRG